MSTQVEFDEVTKGLEAREALAFRLNEQISILDQRFKENQQEILTLRQWITDNPVDEAPDPQAVEDPPKESPKKTTKKAKAKPKKKG